MTRIERIVLVLLILPTSIFAQERCRLTCAQLCKAVFVSAGLYIAARVGYAVNNNAIQYLAPIELTSNVCTATLLDERGAVINSTTLDCSDVLLNSRTHTLLIRRSKKT